MAHNLEFNQQKQTTSFFSRKELAWHGLGQVVSEAVTASEALKLANLDYNVELKPIWTNYIPKGCSGEIVDIQGKSQVIVKDSFTGSATGLILPYKGELITTAKAVCRMDTYKTLGIVGNKYTPVQNIQSLEFIYDILKHNPDIQEHDDITIETAGVLGQGERIFVTAKLPKEFRIGNEEVGTELYIVFTNSHDGTSSLTAMITPVRVVCNNTLTMALGNNKSKIAFRHTSNIANAMKEGCQLLGLSYSNFEMNYNAYSALNRVNVTQDMVDELICRAMLNDNQLELVARVGFKNVSTDIIPTRTRNVIQDMRDFVDVGVGQNYNRGTAYWAYMGMNSYLNNGTNFKDYESKFDKLLSGDTSKLDAKILQNCLELV